MLGSHHRCTISDEIYTTVAFPNEIFSVVNFVLQFCRLRCNAQEFELNCSRGMCMIQSMNAYYHIQSTRQTCRFAFVVNQGISQRKFDKACSLNMHIKKILFENGFQLWICKSTVDSCIFLLHRDCEFWK